MTETKKDVFLCHATVDKNLIVNPISEGLEKAGISCWYDEAEIQWGDSITQKVNEGLMISRYVIVVLSSNFIKKKWPQRELNAALNIESASGEVRVLALLVGTDQERADILANYPLLNDKKFLTWNKDIDEIVSALKMRLAKSGNFNSEVEKSQGPERIAEDDWLDLLEEGNEIKIKRHLKELRKRVELSDEIVLIGKGEKNFETTGSLFENIDSISRQLRTLIEYDLKQYRQELIDILANAYSSIMGPDPYQTEEYPAQVQADLFTSIIARVYLLGATALHMGRYDFVRPLICVYPSNSKYSCEFYWARHALILFARASNKKEGLVGITNASIPKISWAIDHFEVGSRETMKLLGSFDFLQCIVAAHDANNIKACYPSFGQFRNYHLNETLVDIASKRGGYAVISNIPDKEIVELLLQLDDYACKEYSYSAGWRRRAFPEEMEQFISKY